MRIVLTYRVKEIIYTLQGEGFHSGRPAVLCRFAGCNLWTGREQDRATAICRFCDTDILGTDGSGGGQFQSVEDLVASISSKWPPGRQQRERRFVVCTGGEPLLQLDEPLVEGLHKAGFRVAVETNGTLAVPNGVDWVCVSPKAGADLVVRSGQELKLVFPQESVDPGIFESFSFENFYLQPMAQGNLERNTRLAIGYCLRHPRWKLSVQIHKILGIQ
jgi:7-carboxy-7-deazaguanine synthase (Cx14CxxC type)